MSVRLRISVRGGVRLHTLAGLLAGVCAALALALPAGALARGAHRGQTIVKRTKSVTVYAPPGKAGASEYFEVVPNSGGGVAPPANLTSPGSRNLSRLGVGARTARTLSKLGATGGQAARWARATAPVRTGAEPGVRSGGGEPGVAPGGGQPGGSGGVGNSGTVGPAGTGSLPRGGSALGGVIELLGGLDADGIGAALPVGLIVLAVGALGFALGRRLRPRRA